MDLRRFFSLFDHKNKRGFTLIEIVISLALLGIVALIAFSMQSFGLKVFNTGSDRYQVQSSTGIVTEYITQRLRYAYGVTILENYLLVPEVEAISNNDAYIFVVDGVDKDSVVFRDKNGTSELSSFDSCQLNFTAASSERSLSFRIYGVLDKEDFDVD
jgi:prepilin-type N-terminal cleavage/methylation domain-containing protein